MLMPEVHPSLDPGTDDGGELFILLIASINVATQATTVGLEDNLLWEQFKLQVS